MSLWKYVAQFLLFHREMDTFMDREEAAKLAHLLQSASLKKKHINKNYEKICTE